MVVRPRIRNNICLTAHPLGCARMVDEHVERVRKLGVMQGPRRVLVVGSSAGYGLAALINAAFGCRAATLSVVHDKGPAGSRTGSAGWYNSAAFAQIARADGLETWSVNGDAFSDETRARAAEVVQERMGAIDLLVYSVAAAVRRDPDDGKLHRSVLKPIDRSASVKTLDFMTGQVGSTHLEPANAAEIAGTVNVMGGDDWERWIAAFDREGLLAAGARTLAFSYVGSQLTHPFYRGATIGRAKEHLEATARRLNGLLEARGGGAWTVVSKTIVTKAGAAIPGFALYASLLYRVMKDAGTHESAVEHINRLFRERLAGERAVAVDAEGRIRLDERESSPEVQAEVQRRWERATTANIGVIGDVEGIRREFLNLFGFEVAGIDYEADVRL